MKRWIGAFWPEPHGYNCELIKLVLSLFIRLGEIIIIQSLFWMDNFICVSCICLKTTCLVSGGITVHKAKHTEKYCEANLTGSSTSTCLIDTKFVFQLSSIFSVQYSVYLHHKLLTLHPSTKSYTVQHSLYPPSSLHWIHFRVPYVMYLHYIGTSLVHFIATVHHSIIIHKWVI